MKILKSISMFCMFFIFGYATINAQNSKEFEKTFPINKDGKLTIETYKGEIRVEIWDKNEVYVYAKMVPDDAGGFLSTSPKKQLDRVSIDYDNSPGSVHVKSDYKKSDSWFGNNTMALVYYEIKMPKTVDLRIEDYKSESKIAGLQSSLELNTYKGEVKIDGHSGPIDLETYKGEVSVRYSKLSDDSRFQTYKGEIRINVPKSAAFTADLDLGKRAGLDTSFGLEKESNRKKHSGYDFKKDINGGGPYVKISSDKGEIRLFD